MLKFATMAQRFVGLLVVAALLAGGGGRSATGASAAAGDLAGDVNCSGAVDAVDALQVLRSVAGLPTTADCLEMAGDTDCDGDADAIDALRILRHVAQLQNQYPEGCTPIGESLSSSDQLIGEALKSGEITEEEAIVYSVFAEFGDSRLPAKYHGAPRRLPDSDAAMVAAARFADLSAEAQQTLRPFLTPPYAEGSWLYLPSVGAGMAAAEPAINPADWTTFDAAGGKVKVWARNIYPGELAKAPLVAAAITDTIWPSLIALMGEEHAPLSDVGYPNNGGDGALDVYLVTIEEEGTFGVAIPYIDVPFDPETLEAGPCEMTPAYIEVDGGEPLGSATEPGILSTTAHEIFHAFQLSFDLYTDCWFPEYKWFMEASATWVEDYVYPAANAEHEAASSYLWNPAGSLDVAGPLASGHEYGAYLFPFFATRKYGGPGLVRLMWEGFTTAESIPAIQSAIEPYGGFEKLWPEFVLHNWNGSTTSWYKDWDGLTRGAQLNDSFGEMVYPPSGGDPDELEGEFNYLSARYYKVHFPNWDAFPVRSVTLKNPLWQNPAINVQGIVKIGQIAGTWQQPEDWSGKEEVTLCRDEDETKRIDQIIIIISNSDWETMEDIQPEVPPTIEGSEIGCTRWIGEAAMTYHRDDSAGVYDRTAEAHDLVFEPVGTQVAAADTQRLELKSGTLEWSFESFSKIIGCSAKFSGTFSATGDSSLSVTPADDKMTYRGRASTHVSGTGECSVDSSSYKYSFTGPETWFSTGPNTQISSDPKHLTGEYTYTEGTVTIHYTWDLRAAPAEEPSFVP